MIYSPSSQKTNSLGSSEIKAVFKTFTQQNFNTIKLNKLQGTDRGSYLLLQHPINKFSHVKLSRMTSEAQRTLPIFTTNCYREDATQPNRR